MKMLHGRGDLVTLAKTGRYVYHGSPDEGVKTFTPRRLESRAEYNSTPTQQDDALIYATNSTDVAIFAAVVFHLGRSGWYANTDTDPIKYTFNADADTVRKAKDSIGYVYVFPKRLFTLNPRTQEYTTRHTIEPIYCVEVKGLDVRPKLDSLKPDPDSRH